MREVGRDALGAEITSDGIEMVYLQFYDGA